MAALKADLRDVNWNKVWPDRMPVILRDLAPTNPFNPRDLWPEETEAAAAVEAEKAVVEDAEEKKGNAKAKKGNAAGGGKLKKADLIRMQLAKDKREKQSKVDEEKLANVKKSNNLLAMKMTTPTGRLKQLYEIMRESCKKKEYTDAVDTLWEIQRAKFMPDRSAGSGKKKPEKQRRAEQEEDDQLRDSLMAVHKKYRKYTKIVNEYLKGRDLIEFQLTDMSDRLPPLNMHHMNKFILDDWQRDVLRHIDQRHSVIVCAPTSSGKTVLSSYVSVVGQKVLFIVPTDPLAWQVAALFQSMVKGTVALITEGNVFLPEEFKVAVGTPRAVESALVEIGYDFEYAVFDEVHDLNGAEGDALERIIKVVTCPFLALSATIGNGEKLKEWWTLHHPRPVHLLEYKGRFINLQRLIWRDHTKHDQEAGEGASKQEFVVLHPCAGITLDYLVKEGFETGDLAFTPRDTFALWKAMQRFYTPAQVEDMSPQEYFKLTVQDESETDMVDSSSKKDKKSAKSKKDKKKGSKSKDDDDDDAVNLGVRTHRITLMESKQYEEAIKRRLQKLAKEDPTATQNVLDFFAPQEDLRKAMIDVKEGRSDEGSSIDVYALVKQLVAKHITPAIAFQLDSVRCRQLFNQLLTAIEAEEFAMYPNFRDKVKAEYAEWEKAQALAKKREARVKAKDKEEDQREAQAFEERPPPDIYAPHPDFVLTPVGYRLSATEFKEIKWQLRWELSEESGDGHLLVRSLRRGIAIYARNLPAAYLRTVQTLAQSGRLAVVFSDESLAYGVNMPFRTCVFCEDTDEKVLTSLMVQQMSGRAGRRGLDRDGNLAFAGLSWERIQTLMRGLLPDVAGRKSLYPTIVLQKLLLPKVHSDRNPEFMQRLVSHPLHDFMKGTNVDNSKPYLVQSIKLMTEWGLISSDLKLKVDRSVAKLVWECRDNCSEAVGLFWILETIFKEFQQKPGDQIVYQLALFNMLLRVVGREQFREDNAHATPLAPLPGNEEAWETMTKLLESYQAKLDAIAGDKDIDSSTLDELRLSVPLIEPLDGYVFRTIVDNQIPPGLGTMQLDEIKKRLRRAGDRLRLMHNILMYSGRYGALEEIARKCFRRIKWILIDSDV